MTRVYSGFVAGDLETTVDTNDNGDTVTTRDITWEDGSGSVEQKVVSEDGTTQINEWGYDKDGEVRDHSSGHK